MINKISNFSSDLPPQFATRNNSHDCRRIWAPPEEGKSLHRSRKAMLLTPCAESSRAGTVRITTLTVHNLSLVCKRDRLLTALKDAPSSIHVPPCILEMLRRHETFPDKVSHHKCPTLSPKCRPRGKQLQPCSRGATAFREGNPCSKEQPLGHPHPPPHQENDKLV